MKVASAALSQEEAVTLAVTVENIPAAVLANINAVNAASVKSDAPSGGPDNGDHIATTDAILILRRLVKLVDASFQP